MSSKAGEKAEFTTVWSGWVLSLYHRKTKVSVSEVTVIDPWASQGRKVLCKICGHSTIVNVKALIDKLMDNK